MAHIAGGPGGGPQKACEHCGRLFNLGNFARHQQSRRCPHQPVGSPEPPAAKKQRELGAAAAAVDLGAAWGAAAGSLSAAGAAPSDDVDAQRGAGAASSVHGADGDAGDVSCSSRGAAGGGNAASDSAEHSRQHAARQPLLGGGKLIELPNSMRNAAQPGMLVDQPGLQQRPRLQDKVSPELWRLLGLIEHANGGGRLSDRSIDDLLRMLRTTNAQIDMPFDSAATYHAWMRDIDASATSWLESDVDVPGVPGRVRFFHVNMEDWLTSTYSNTSFAYQGADGVEFVIEAAERYEDDVRVLTEPQECDGWIDAQAQARLLHPQAVAAPIQLWSDKTELNHKGENAWPVRAALLNVPLCHRIGNLDLVALIPAIKHPDSMVKLSVLSACIGHLLAPVREIVQQRRLLQICDPYGEQRWVWPYLASYVADTPERCMLLSIYSGGTASAKQRPCMRCLVPGADLADLQAGRVADLRTEAAQRQLYQAIQQQPTKALREQLCREFCTQPVPSGLWGLGGDCHQATAVELMHDFELGLVGYLISMIGRYAACMGARSSRVLSELDARLQRMPRLPHLRKPGNGYFANLGSGSYQACEHKAILAMLPHLCAGLVPFKRDRLSTAAQQLVPASVRDPLCEAATLMRLLAMERSRARRPSAQTEETLRCCEQLLQRLDPLMRALASCAGKQLATLKYHAQVHFAADSQRLGHAMQFSADFFEAANKDLHHLYSATSRKTLDMRYAWEMVQRSATDRAFSALCAMEGVDDMGYGVKRTSAYLRAADSGQHTMARSGVVYSLQVLESGSGGAQLLSSNVRAASMQRREQQPIMQHLQLKLLEFYNDQQLGAQALAAGSSAGTGAGAAGAVRAAGAAGAAAGSGQAASGQQPAARRAAPLAQRELRPLPADGIITAVQTAVLAAEVWWQSEACLQTVRASPNFYGRPAFDFVTIDVQGKPTLARLHCLFRLQLYNDTTEELAFVEWFAGAGGAANALTREAGCKRVRPAPPHVYKGPPRQQLPALDVVRLASILRKEVVVPDFEAKEGERYYVSELL